MGVFNKSPLVVLNSVVVLLVCLLLNGAQSRDSTCDIEIEATLRKLLTPQQSPSIQLQALRKDILRKFSEALQRIDEEDQENYKRSLSSLAAWNNLPYGSDKRNVEALARGGYIKTLPEDGEEDDDSNFKRSLASLAKNGQLPAMQTEEHKRGIESLARNGELPSNTKDMDREYYYKRNIGSLAKNYNLPGKRYLGSLARAGSLRYKKNIQAIARDGGLSGNKRNVAALLRMEDYLSNQQEHQNGFTQKPRDLSADKRNIASIKAQYPKFKRSLASGERAKRQVYYDDDDDYSSEFASPVYQNQNVYDYEELLKELTGAYPNTEKRFLGSVARSGWFRQPNSRYNQLRNTPEKRHIGSLARLGWLPTLRNIRRFNRSGRSTDISDSCREVAKNGNIEDNTIAEDPYFGEVDEDKRFLLQPAVDNILLRKILNNPRSISS